jgi:hypothetical protein
MEKQYKQRIKLFPTKSAYVFTVGLRLDHETRFIGKLDKGGEGTFISNKRTETHLFEKLNALGVNRELCERFNFRWVVVPYCDRKLWTSRLFLLHHGKAFSFGKKGFEPQCFLALHEWGIEKAKAFEANLSKQGNLFGEAA